MTISTCLGAETCDGLSMVCLVSLSGAWQRSPFLRALVDSINWVAVGIVSVVSAALSAVFGLKFLSWLEEILGSW